MILRPVATYLSRHQGTILQWMLGAIFVLFIGILVTVYLVARSVNPVILDEHGQPISAGAEPSSAPPN